MFSINTSTNTNMVLQQNDNTQQGWVDVAGSTNSNGNGNGTSLRMFTGNGSERWELRSGILGTGTWDLFYVSPDGSNAYTIMQSTGASSGSSTLMLPNLGTPPGGSVDLVVDTSGNVYQQSSSLRYKDNVRPLAEDFAKVMALTPISFTYKGGSGEQIGYTAEAVEAAGLRHLVSHDEEGRPAAVSYKHLGIYAIEILKQQQKVIDDLRATVDGLQAKLNS